MILIFVLIKIVGTGREKRKRQTEKEKNLDVIFLGPIKINVNIIHFQIQFFRFDHLLGPIIITLVKLKIKPSITS